MKWLLLLLASACAMPSKTENFCLPKRITPMLGAIFLLGFAATSSAAVENFQTGEVLNHELSACLDKKAAIAIVDADSKSGRAAATKLFIDNARCNTVSVSGPQVGSVVHSAKIQRDGETLTASVVEIVMGGEVIGYFLTTKPVTAKLAVVPRSNS